MNQLNGLVLCGGQSSRMGEDKSILKYHGKAQRYHVYEMLLSFCKQVFISCNAGQAKSMAAGYDIIVDDEKFSGAGPVTGLLSAFQKHPDDGFLVVGCDYPFIEKKNIRCLIDERTGFDDAVCYCRQEYMINEPLFTIYENRSHQKILKNFQEKKFSLRDYLSESNTCMIFPDNLDFLKSVDDIKSYHQAKELLTAKLN